MGLSRPCVFLDRDGVINEKAPPHEYIRNWEEFKFLPNIADWIKIFNALGYLVIVVTNQRGIARGLMTGGAVEEIHENMREELAKQGAKIDDVFTCPHEQGTCNCRKPKPGLIHQAEAKWQIDMEHSLLIGDSEDDEKLAQACNLRFLKTNGAGALLSK